MVDSQFVNDNDVLNGISDDMIYLRELVERERHASISYLKQAHLGRLVVVFCYNAMEAYKDLIVRQEKFGGTGMSWKVFLLNSPLTQYFTRIVDGETINLGNLEGVLDQVLGLKTLRDFISHGLVDESARDFQEKLGTLSTAGLLKNPMQLTIDDVDRVLTFDAAITNLVGMGRALRTSDGVRSAR